MAINPSIPDDQQVPQDPQDVQEPQPAPEMQEPTAGPPIGKPEHETEHLESDEHEAPLADDEEYASDDEMRLLYKVMIHVFDTLTNSGDQIPKLLSQSPAVSKSIGDLTFQILGEIFLSAAHGGEQIPGDVFLMQGGALYQTIDAISDLAESAGIKVTDADRHNAAAYAVENYKNSRLAQGNVDVEEVVPHIEEMQGIKHGGEQESTPKHLPMKPLPGAIQHGLLEGMRNA